MDLALLETLEKQHREAESLLEKLSRAESAEQQKPLVDKLLTAMAEHMRIEESEVYPELKRVDDEIEEEAETEHGLAREGLGKLSELVGQPGFGAVVAMVQAGIEHHVEEEEKEAFPKLRQAMGSPGAQSGHDRAMTKDELYTEAQRRDIPGRSEMTKDELRAALDM